MTCRTRTAGSRCPGGSAWHTTTGRPLSSGPHVSSACMGPTGERVLLRCVCASEGARPGVEQADEQDSQGGEAEGPGGVTVAMCPVDEQCGQDEPGPSGDEIGDGPVAGDVRIPLP